MLPYKINHSITNIYDHAVDLVGKLSEDFSTYESYFNLEQSFQFDNKKQTIDRVSAACLQTIANKFNYLIVGDICASQRFVGLYTPHADDVCDFNPIASLTYSEINSLYKFLNLPDYIEDESKEEEKQIKLKYIDIDNYIRFKESGDDETDVKIRNLYEQNKHKLIPPLTYSPVSYRKDKR